MLAKEVLPFTYTLHVYILILEVYFISNLFRCLIKWPLLTVITILYTIYYHTIDCESQILAKVHMKTSWLNHVFYQSSGEYLVRRWRSRGDGWGTAERSGWPPAGGAWRQEGEYSSPVEDEGSGLRVYKNSLYSSALQQKWWFYVCCPSETETYVCIMLIYPTINKNKPSAAVHLKLIRMDFTNTRVNWKFLLCS